MQINGPLKRAQFEELASDPVGVELVVGRLWKITSQNVFKVYDGAAVRTFADLNSAQTFQNKTLNEATFTQIATPANPSAGFSKLYPKTDGKFYTLDSLGNEAAVGSGSGGGVDNLIVNGSADDTASSIFVPYADAAGTRPVDGTGGSPTVTTAITTTNPLNKTKSFTLVKPASNVQGQGWSVPFDVPLAYRAKSIKISTKYILDSGTFVPGSPGVDGDVIVYLYDITNSQLIEPSNIKLLSNSTTLSDVYESTFQTSPTGSQYRLIFHVASTSALAYTLKVDDVTVSPQVYVYGTPVTDWQSFTPTGSWTTNTTYTGRWRRIGDSAEIQVRVATSGAPTAAILSVNLPPGMTIDTGKLASLTNPANLGMGKVHDQGTQEYTVAVSYSTPTQVVPNFIATGGASATDGTTNTTNSNPITFGAGDSVQFSYSVPIVGWSSSVQMSDQADTRVVAEGLTTNAGQSIANNAAALINLNTLIHSTHGGSDFTVGKRINILVSGYYDVKGQVALNSGASEGRITVSVFKNGSTLFQTLGRGNASGNDSVLTSSTVFLNVGDYLELHCINDTGSSATVANNAASTFLYATRVSGPSAIAASEKIYAEYTTSAGQSMTAVTNTRINYGTKVRDSHNAVTVGASWVFTAPRSDTYEVEASFAPSAQAASSEKQLTLFKNGASLRRMHRSRNTAAGTDDQSAYGATSVYLLQGETIDIRGLLSTTQNLTTADVDNWVTIKSHGGV